eukprot:TRINITY_DN8311_c0_g1_i1.p1 TRINITY_DN8311_c0_g1~~TRINITY_DN8311_c0_g1_i1.p1  ORF type:complete len:1077 (+),score=315.23 TRINITY_DN8311_c0_g1_i1:87-3317(+)
MSFPRPGPGGPVGGGPRLRPAPGGLNGSGFAPFSDPSVPLTSGNFLRSPTQISPATTSVPPSPARTQGAPPPTQSLPAARDQIASPQMPLQRYPNSAQPRITPLQRPGQGPPLDVVFQTLEGPVVDVSYEPPLRDDRGPRPEGYLLQGRPLASVPSRASQSEAMHSSARKISTMRVPDSPAQATSAVSPNLDGRFAEMESVLARRCEELDARFQGRLQSLEAQLAQHQAQRLQELELTFQAKLSNLEAMMVQMEQQQKQEMAALQGRFGQIHDLQSQQLQGIAASQQDMQVVMQAHGDLKERLMAVELRKPESAPVATPQADMSLLAAMSERHQLLNGTVEEHQRLLAEQQASLEAVLAKNQEMGSADELLRQMQPQVEQLAATQMDQAKQIEEALLSLERQVEELRRAGPPGAGAPDAGAGAVSPADLEALQQGLHALDQALLQHENTTKEQLGQCTEISNQQTASIQELQDSLARKGASQSPAELASVTAMQLETQKLLQEAFARVQRLEEERAVASGGAAPDAPARPAELDDMMLRVQRLEANASSPRADLELQHHIQDLAEKMRNLEADSSAAKQTIPTLVMQLRAVEDQMSAMGGSPEGSAGAGDLEQLRGLHGETSRNIDHLLQRNMDHEKALSDFREHSIVIQEQMSNLQQQVENVREARPSMSSHTAALDEYGAGLDALHSKVDDHMNSSQEKQEAQKQLLTEQAQYITNLQDSMKEVSDSLQTLRSDHHNALAKTTRSLEERLAEMRMDRVLSNPGSPTDSQGGGLLSAVPMDEVHERLAFLERAYDKQEKESKKATMLALPDQMKKINEKLFHFAEQREAMLSGKYKASQSPRSARSRGESMQMLQRADDDKHKEMREQACRIRGQLLHTIQELLDVAYTEEHRQDIMRKNADVASHSLCMSMFVDSKTQVSEGKQSSLEEQCKALERKEETLVRSMPTEGEEDRELELRLAEAEARGDMLENKCRLLEGRQTNLEKLQQPDTDAADPTLQTALSTAELKRMELTEQADCLTRRIEVLERLMEPGHKITPRGSLLESLASAESRRQTLEERVRMLEDICRVLEAQR